MASLLIQPVNLVLAHVYANRRGAPRGAQEERRLAHRLRTRFEAESIFVVNLVSSPGSGKTALLQRTLKAMQPDLRVAALVGDLACRNILQVRPGLFIVETSARREEGLEAWLDILERRRLEGTKPVAIGEAAGHRSSASQA